MSDVNSASASAFGQKRLVGDRIAPLTVQTLAHGSLQLPGPGWVHLQFRRFAGCPVCNLHLRSFARAYDRIRAAGLTTVAFMHSPREQMLPYQGDLPFPTVPDPDRIWYREFGTERSWLAVAHVQVVGSALRGLFTERSNPFVGGADQTQLPADFLVSPQGTLAHAHYGQHADDHWEVEELLALHHECLRDAGLGFPSSLG